MKNVTIVLTALVAVLFLYPARSRAAENAGNKAWQIVVPVFELREASIEESIRALATKSRELDPARTGVNFVWPPNLPAEARLNLRLANVPLYEAARYVGRLAGLRLVAQPHALLFAPDDGQKPPAPPRFSQPAARAAELIVPRVDLRAATLPAALVYIEKLGRAADPRKVGVNVVIDVPPEVREKKITLSLSNVPLGEALRYAAGLADLVVVDESYALVVTVPKPKTPGPKSPDAGEQKPLASPKEPANPLAEAE